MNTKNLFAVTMLFFSLIHVSCEKNEMDGNSVIHDYRIQGDLYAKGSKVKNISYVESVNSKKRGMITSQYEYDEWGRISKVSQPRYEDGTPIFENGTIVGLFSYSDYVYNNEGLLDKIIYYHSNIYAGFLNLQTHTYSYDKSGNKIKEVIEYPQITQDRTDITIYHCDNNRLKREDIYNGGVFNKGLISYTEYEYDNQGKLIEEITYFTGDNTSYKMTKHNYQDGINVKTEIFNHNNGKTEQIREIRRYYDKNDNLIYLESEELSLSSSMSYVTKYEYY